MPEFILLSFLVISAEANSHNEKWHQHWNTTHYIFNIEINLLVI
jgi:hypothetical protein